MEKRISAKYIQDQVDPFFYIIHKNGVSSTNDVLIQMALNGEAEGTVLIADFQTAGKGRKGRSFYSPDAKGVYLSILLRPEFSPEVSVKLTPLTAVAVAEAIESVTDKKSEIKWVNDILINGKKVCGILTESSYSSIKRKFDHIVIGIGINLYRPENGYPDEIKNIATALSDNSECEIDVNKLIVEILNRFIKYYSLLPSVTFFKEYESRISFLGEKIKVIHFDYNEECIAEDITDEFHLIVRDKNGKVQELDSGEISILI